MVYIYKIRRLTTSPTRRPVTNSIYVIRIHPVSHHQARTTKHQVQQYSMQDRQGILVEKQTSHTFRLHPDVSPHYAKNLELELSGDISQEPCLKSRMKTIPPCINARLCPEHMKHHGCTQNGHHRNTPSRKVHTSHTQQEE